MPVQCRACMFHLPLPLCSLPFQALFIPVMLFSSVVLGRSWQGAEEPMWEQSTGIAPKFKGKSSKVLFCMDKPAMEEEALACLCNAESKEAGRAPPALQHSSFLPSNPFLPTAWAPPCSDAADCRFSCPPALLRAGPSRTPPST